MSSFEVDSGSFDECLSGSVEINLHGRFMLPSKEECPCRVTKMSTREMVISSPVVPRVGEQVVVYILELGRFEGSAERREPEGFVVSMVLPPTKCQKLAEQLLWFANRNSSGSEDRRIYKRIVPTSEVTILRFSNGKEHFARINDISSNGVKIEISISLLNARVLVGSRVAIGKKMATVVRKFSDGFVAEFEAPFEEIYLDDSI